MKNMYRHLPLLCLLLASLCALNTVPVAARPYPAAVAPDATAPAAPAGVIVTDDYFLYLPKNADMHQPLQILVTIHGMGGEGKTFCQNLLDQADANGWVVVSPTFHYRDYKVVANVVADDTAMLPRVKQMLDQLPGRTGLTFRPKVLLYGFSRGAQMVHRFAEWYPERVQAVALFSAGSYTLPRTAMTMGGVAQNMAYPFGVADLAQVGGLPFNEAAFRNVPFFIGVGGADTNPGDTPREWDATQGTTRVARAQAFANTLRRMEMQPTVRLFPGVGHEVTPEMRGAALAFLLAQADTTAYPFALPAAA